MPRYFSESSCFLRIPFFPFNYGAYLIDAVAVVFFFRKEIPVEAELLSGLILTELVINTAVNLIGRIYPRVI